MAETSLINQSWRSLELRHPFSLDCIAVKSLQPTGAFSSVFAPVLMQTPQQKAYNRGGATPREHFRLILLPYPLKNMTSGAFLPLFAPVSVQTPQQKAYNGGNATPREHFRLILLPWFARILGNRQKSWPLISQTCNSHQSSHQNYHQTSHQTSRLNSHQNSHKSSHQSFHKNSHQNGRIDRFLLEVSGGHFHWGTPFWSIEPRRA